MKRIYILLILLILFNTNSYTQFDITDQLTIGGDENFQVSSLVASPDGGFYLAAATTSNSFSGNLTVEVPGDRGVVITKYTNNLDIDWQKSYGGDGNEFLYDLIDAGDGLLMLVSSNSQPSGNKTSPNFGGSDAWVVKLDYDGEIVWQETYGGSLSELSVLAILLNNNEILLGITSASDISGNKTTNSIGTNDFWVVKINSTGDILWQESYGGESGETIFSITQNNDQNIILVGSSSSDSSGNKSENNYGLQDIWVLCIDTNGSILWDKTLGSEGFEVTGQVVANEGKLFILINGSTDTSESGNRTAIKKGLTDIWMVELDNNGVVIDQKSFGGDGQENGGKYSILPDGRFLVSATSDSDISYDKTENSRGNNDYWPLLFSKDGNLIWQKTIGGDNWDGLSSRAAIIQDEIILAGVTRSDVSADKTVGSISPFPEFDTWIVVLDAEALNTVEAHLDIPEIIVYPNPAATKLYINPANTEIHEVSIVNSIGQIVAAFHDLSSENNQLFEIDMESFKNGVYVLKIKGENFIVDKKVVKE